MAEITENTTIDKILDAAREIFIEHGFDGARMQQIADHAGINKALLHYYFRTKENLFKAVFSRIFGSFFPNFIKVLQSEIPFEEKIKNIVENYTQFLQTNPQLPVFILYELQRKPELLVSSLTVAGANPELILSSIEKELIDRNISPDQAPHLLINLLSMCIFPVVATPFIKGFIFSNRAEDFESFMQKRNQLIVNFILQNIQ